MSILIYLFTVVSLNLNDSLYVAQQTINILKKNCESRQNICDINNFDMIESSMRNVHGNIYKLRIKTNMGRLDIESWYQDLPNITSIHKFTLNNHDYIDTPLRIHGNLYKNLL